jgi:hypothetical protein
MKILVFGVLFFAFENFERLGLSSGRPRLQTPRDSMVLAQPHSLQLFYLFFITLDSHHYSNYYHGQL